MYVATDGKIDARSLVCSSLARWVGESDSAAARSEGDEVGAQADAASERAEPAPERAYNRGVPMARRVEARALFKEGNRLMSVPSFLQAARKYQAALALYRHPVFYFNLALAQFNLVQPVESYEHFGAAMAYGPEVLGELSYQRAQQYRRRLAEQLARVEVACAQAGAEVTLDGRVLFIGPGRYEGMVTPGAHQLVASRAGFVPETERLVLSAGEHRQVELSLARPERVLAVRRWPVWRPWAVVVGGAAALAVAGALDWQGDRVLADYDAAVAARCSGEDGCETASLAAELRAERARGLSFDRRATVVYAVGATAIASGAVLLFLNRERTLRSPAEREPAVRLTPQVSGDGVAMTLSGRF